MLTKMKDEQKQAYEDILFYNLLKYKKQRLREKYPKEVDNDVLCRNELLTISPMQVWKIFVRTFGQGGTRGPQSNTR